MKKPEHLAALSLGDIFVESGNIVLIEWPEKAKKFLPKDMTWIKFKYGRKENERTISITHPVKK